MKTVSVVMCTYNGEKFLREQMDSILAQTYPIKEIIVQDDGSTDATIDIVKGYAAEHSNIKFFQNEHNIGFNLNFETAAMRATGDYIAISDQDDIWFPEKIAKLVANIGNHSICFCDVLRGEKQESSPRTHYKYTLETLLFRSVVGHAMVLVRAFAQDKKNWHVSRIYDWSLALAAHLRGNGIAKVDEPLIWHRVHAGEVTAPKGGSQAKPKVWHPYVYGWKAYREAQETSYWQSVYSGIKAINKKNKLVNKILRCLVSRRLIDLLKLCVLCMVNKDKVYPGNSKGLIGYFRGFFFPSIFAYYNKNEFAPG